MRGTVRCVAAAALQAVVSVSWFVDRRPNDHPKGTGTRDASQLEEPAPPTASFVSTSFFHEPNTHRAHSSGSGVDPPSQDTHPTSHHVPEGASRGAGCKGCQSLQRPSGAFSLRSP